VQKYTRFTIFDDVSASVDDGVVTLTGKVTAPFKKDDLAARVSRVEGVHTVNNQIGILPVSPFDDDLRYRIARAIYGHSNFWQYAAMANPPIHIVVEQGRVTLTGVVNSNVERMLARSLATTFGAFSVKNELKTDAEVQAQLEKSGSRHEAVVPGACSGHPARPLRASFPASAHRVPEYSRTLPQS
jgi:hyperosmotically inducible protein